MLCCTSALASTAAVLWYRGERNTPLAALASLVAIAICIAAYRSPVATSPRNSELSSLFLHAVDKSIATMTAAVNAVELWAAVREFAQSTGARSLFVDIRWNDGDQSFERRFRWQPTPIPRLVTGKHRDSCRCNGVEAHLEVAWPSQSAEPADQIASALASISRALATRAAQVISETQVRPAKVEIRTRRAKRTSTLPLE
jgi:hypothetical protein